MDTTYNQDIAPNFDKMNGLVPAIVQDVNTNEVLMLGFMNQQAYDKTLKENKVTFYSRTRDSLWTKGETSNNFLVVKKILADCDNDTLLIMAEPTGPVCHTGSNTCFGPGQPPFGLNTLEKLIGKRKQEMPEKSYTTELFKKGINKIAQKVGEEAVELIIEAKDSNNELFLNEAADLVYHFLVLLAAKGVKLNDVTKLLEQRHRKAL